MIRPQIVPYTDEWRPGVAELGRAAGWPNRIAAMAWNPETTLVAVHHGAVVGFLAGWVGGQPIGIMDVLLVAPQVQGHGIGVALVAAMILVMRHQGVTRIRACATHHVSRKICERLGFRALEPGMMLEWWAETGGQDE